MFFWWESYDSNSINGHSQSQSKFLCDVGVVLQHPYYTWIQKLFLDGSYPLGSLSDNHKHLRPRSWLITSRLASWSTAQTNSRGMWSLLLQNFKHKAKRRGYFFSLSELMTHYRFGEKIWTRINALPDIWHSLKIHLPLTLCRETV